MALESNSLETSAPVFDGNVYIKGGKVIIDGGYINVIQQPKTRNELVISVAQNLYANTAFDMVQMSPENISALCIKRAEAFVNVAQKLKYI
jgi:ABC-type uncharacterized transport system ATPase component